MARYTPPMGGRLRRLVPVLRGVGIEVSMERAASRDRTRRYTIRRIVDSTVQTVQSSVILPAGPEDCAALRTVADDSGRSEVGNRPAQEPVAESVLGISDGSDDVDGCLRATSDGEWAGKGFLERADI